MNRLARVQAPAKINVWLRVIGPRPDGYHDLLTLFQALELADEVTVRATERVTRSLDVTGDRLPSGGLGPTDRNLAYRAAMAFQERTGWPRGFEIGLVKRIPVGGGLGGGSSDAGAVLRALNALAPHPLTAHELAGLAAALGSDVPFLVSEVVRCIGSGRGETLVPATTGPFNLPQADVLLIVPDFAIATADAYRWLREAGAHDAGEPEENRANAEAKGWAAHDLGNTFERVVEPRFADIARYRALLRQHGAAIARLSGSGSTVFGLFPRRPPRIPEVESRAILTRTARSVVPVEVQE